MSEQDLKRHRCCFTGHRPEKLNISEQEAKKLLRTEIKKAISDGFVTFISGMARGIDMWAAEIVLEERSGNPDIHLICASPYEGFEKKWDIDEQSKYQHILSQADYVKFVCDHYSRSCFQIRNIYMVERSSRVIAAYNGSAGGTRNTTLYATRKSVDIVNIL